MNHDWEFATVHELRAVCDRRQIARLARSAARHFGFLDGRFESEVLTAILDPGGEALEMRSEVRK